MMHLDELLESIIPYTTRGGAVMNLEKRARIKRRLISMAEKDEQIKKLIGKQGNHYVYNPKHHTFIGYLMHQKLDSLMQRK